VNTKVCGGECTTSAQEMASAMEIEAYDFVQPYATVLGGAGQVMEVFTAARQYGMGVVVHCWGGSLCMMANYHAAFAGGSTLAEWPSKSYALREPTLVKPLLIVEGLVSAPTAPGLGVQLTSEIEREFAFREDVMYRCCIPQSCAPSDDVRQ
jgi:L-alanine-DL-glutamate epimerase-like enolase superfamily enzyme